jgi:hypothetical protein
VRKYMILATLCALIVSLAAAPAMAQAETVVLQEGLDGYAGTLDAYIDRWEPHRNWSGNGWLMVTESNDRAALIRFDLADQVPEGATVTGATLELYITERSKPLGQKVAAYAMLRPWAEREADWTRAAVGHPWDVAGCNGPDDHDPVAVDTIAVKKTEQWCTFDVASAVRLWVNAPDENYGLLLKGVDEDQPAEFIFFSSNSGEKERRPILRITYTVPAPFPSAARLRFDPASTTVERDAGAFTLDVAMDAADDLGGFQTSLSFDPNVVHVESIALGSLLTGSARTFTALGPLVDNDAGTATFGAFSVGAAPGPSGSGAVATITFAPAGAGTSALHLSAAQVRDTHGAAAAVMLQDGAVTVQGGPLIGDVNGDCVVDLADVMLVAEHWGAQQGGANYDTRYDLDADGDVDVADVMVVAGHWGQRC